MKKKYLMEYNMIFANILSTILMFVCIGVGFLVFYFNLITVESFKFNFFSFFIFIVIMFGYLGIHELVHGITYRLTGAKSENIKYGFKYGNSKSNFFKRTKGEENNNLPNSK